jgi:DNA-binding response OmpR family regulator
MTAETVARPLMTVLQERSMFNPLKRKPHVLVLDDDVAMQKLVKMLLKRDGYRVDVVGDGRDAINSLEKNKNAYAAVVLDLMMPTEGGMTVIKHLREEHPEVLQKVIVLTATPGAVLKGIAKEVFAVITKPFQADDLLATVRRLI